MSESYHEETDYKAFVRRALAITIQDTLKGSVAFCVKFLRHEMECVPKHLIFEMYRAYSTDDCRHRDPWRDNWMDITITCPCNVYPLEPHFYTTKLGYAGVYLFFLFLLQNIDCGYSLEPPRRGGSNVYPQSLF